MALTTPCANCGDLPEFLETECELNDPESKSGESFKAAVERLADPNASLKEYASGKDECLLTCPKCRGYFLYRQWIPGGSDDFGRSYLHQSLERMSHLAAYEWLDGACRDAREMVSKYGTSFQDKLDQISHGMDRERRRLNRRHQEIVSSALDALDNRYAQSQARERSLRETYGDSLHRFGSLIEAGREKDRRVAEYHAWILGEFIPLFRNRRVFTRIADRLIGCLHDEQRVIRQTIHQAILRLMEQAGLRRPVLARRLIRRFERQPPATPEAMAVRAACQDILESARPAAEGRQPGTDESVKSAFIDMSEFNQERFP